MTVVTLLLCAVAFAAFALSTDPHHHRVRGRKPDATAKRRLRTGAWVAVAAALPTAMLAAGPIYGPVLWVGAAMLAAAIVFLLVNVVMAESVDPGRRR